MFHHIYSSTYWEHPEAQKLSRFNLVFQEPSWTSVLSPPSSQVLAIYSGMSWPLGRAPLLPGWPYGLLEKKNNNNCLDWVALTKVYLIWLRVVLIFICFWKWPGHICSAAPKIACSCPRRISWTYFLKPSSGEGPGTVRKADFIPFLKWRKASCKQV